MVSAANALSMTSAGAIANNRICGRAFSATRQTTTGTAYTAATFESVCSESVRVLIFVILSYLWKVGYVI